eukprot:COSAG05_NODE_933_length_6538_cov_16.519646_3_plen_96_part_00
MAEDEAPRPRKNGTVRQYVTVDHFDLAIYAVYVRVWAQGDWSLPSGGQYAMGWRGGGDSVQRQPVRLSGLEPYGSDVDMLVLVSQLISFPTYGIC